MGTYSFLDVQCAIVGPGGSFGLNGTGVAEEGVTVSMNDDKGSMVTGADGEVMHSLHAGKSGTIMVRLLKTSPANQQMNQLYNFQTQSAAFYGQNVISIRNPVTGDSITARECGFRKLPDNANGKEAGVMEWAFNCGKIDEVLGNGNPAL